MIDAKKTNKNKELTQPKERKPIAFDELKKMDGLPVWCEELACWGIVLVDEVGRYAGNPFLLGRCDGVRFEYDIERRGLTLYLEK